MLTFEIKKVMQINLNHSEIAVGLICLACFLLSTFFVGKFWIKFRSRRWIVTTFWGLLAAWCVIVDGERMKETGTIIIIACGAAQSIIFQLMSTYERLKINIGNNVSIEADNKGPSNLPGGEAQSAPVPEGK
jgi:hypothetical protein